MTAIIAGTFSNRARIAIDSYLSTAARPAAIGARPVTLFDGLTVYSMALGSVLRTPTVAF